MTKLEEKGAELLEATVKLITSIQGLLEESIGKPAAASSRKDIPAPDLTRPIDPTTARAPADKDLKAQVKLAAANVLKKRGTAVLKDLLETFGVKKISQLKPGAGVFEDFIERADHALQSEEPATEPQAVEAPTVEVPAEEPQAPAVTHADVKKLLIAVNGSKELGRGFTAKILAELGASRLSDLKPEQYAEAAKVAGKLLEVEAF